MKRAIIRNNMILLIIAFILFFCVAFFSVYRYERQNQASFMTFLLQEVENEYENYDGNIYTFVALYEEQDRRITILDENGIVLVDSHDLNVGQDKSQRPEILDLGSVSSRTSVTIDVELLYIATRLEDGNFLRVSIPMASQVNLYSTIAWYLGVTAIIVTIIYYFSLKRINRFVLSPLKTIKQGLVALNQGRYQVMHLNSKYSDVNELIHEMNLVNLETSTYLKQVEAYQNELSAILNQMKQGVMLFNEKGMITFYNKDAKKLFDLEKEDLNQPLYQKIRDVALKEAIEKTNLEHIDLKFDLILKDKILEVKTIRLDDTKLLKNHPTVLARLKDVTSERQLAQVKRDFFSHASHELKSPLTAISGHAELIEHGFIKDDKEIIEAAQMIHNQAMHMSLLVEDMLMLSRLEQLETKDYEKQDLNQILNSTIEILKPLIQSKQMQLKINAKKIMMNCDPVDLQKLFKNLIENACKYSDENKEITVELYQKSDNIYFSVIDQGFGISLEHQQRVFERFYRVDKGRLDGGTGLGLAIVKHIVIKYNGHIDLTSQYGKGTKILIHLKEFNS